MKYKKILTNALSDKKAREITVVAIVAGVVIGVLFTTNKGKAFRKKITDSTRNIIHTLTGNTRKNANVKLGNLIIDVSRHIKQNAEGMLG